jgi:hypothetical protein
MAVQLAWFIVPLCLVLAAVCFKVWDLTRHKRSAEIGAILCPPEEVEI